MTAIYAFLANQEPGTYILFLIGCALFFMWLFVKGNDEDTEVPNENCMLSLSFYTGTDPTAQVATISGTITNASGNLGRALRGDKTDHKLGLYSVITLHANQLHKQEFWLLSEWLRTLPYLWAEEDEDDLGSGCLYMLPKDKNAVQTTYYLAAVYPIFVRVAQEVDSEFYEATVAFRVKWAERVKNRAPSHPKLDNIVLDRLAVPA